MNWKFWKKEDDLGLPDLSSDFSTPSNALSAPSVPPPTPDPLATPGFTAQPPAFAPMGSNVVAAEPHNDNQDLHMQLITAKLDAISNKLDSVSHRLEQIEIKQQQQKGPWYAK